MCRSYDAIRYVNWLYNGQPTGVQDSTTTEDGAYTITPAAVATNSITRNAGATIFLPTEDEWYKAAYYDPGSLGYNRYPFADGFDGAACEIPSGTGGHSANCDLAIFADFAGLTDVGAYPSSPSAYGTFDQGGNVWEWNETIVGSGRGERGGSFINGETTLSVSALRLGPTPTFWAFSLGFRVASLPEPGTGVLFLTGCLGLAVWLRR